MKKTLIIGLALAFGLNACHPMMNIDDMSFIRVETPAGVVLGNNSPDAVGGEYGVIYGEPIVLTGQNSTTLRVVSSQPYIQFGHHLTGIDHGYLVEGGTWQSHFTSPFAIAGNVIDMEFDYVALADTDANIGIMRAANGMLVVDYLCPFTKWGHLLADGKTLATWTPEAITRPLPVIRVGLFSGEIVVTRRYGTIVVGNPAATATAAALAIATLAQLEAMTPAELLAAGVAKTITYDYLDVTFEMHVEGSGWVGGYVDYSGFQVILPNAIRETVAITYDVI